MEEKEQQNLSENFSVLCSLQPDKTKIYRSAAIRLAAVSAAFIVQRVWTESFFVVASLLILYAIFVIFPFRHMSDSMQYCNGAIKYKGMLYEMHSPNDISWKTVEYLAFRNEYLVVGNIKLDVTYLMESKKKFYQTYNSNYVEDSVTKKEFK